jgi:tetratricopeptide (TPR) repeat protein
MRHLLILFFALTTASAWTQVSEKYHSPLSGFYRAEDLFEKEQYSAARKEFRLFADDYKGSKNDPFYIKALYYEGISALELFNNDAIDLLENFNLDYPESIYKHEISLRIGRYYYQKKDYEKAIEWFEKLERQDIEAMNLDEYYFKLGYANFHEKKYPAAKSAFFEVKESTGQYGAPGLYYYSHICYLDSSYQSALEGFERLMSDPRFNTVVPYYITQIYHMQGKYEEVVRFDHSKLDSLKPNERVEMNHIIGDSYYRLKKYDEAVPFLEYYNEKANSTRDDDYALAIAYSKSSNCTKAVSYFDKVARVKDILGQIALYHAGECYMNMDQLVYARTAFEAAAQLDMDPLIQEDALYNYAVLSYKLDMNAYDEAVEALELYLTKYPDSKRKNVVYEYLVNVYSSTKNYAKALASLEKLPNKDIKLKSAYQVIAFNRGVELFLKSDYTNALSAFELVDKYPMSQDLSAKATYWSADAYFQLKNYNQAVKNYNAFLAMPSTYLSGLRADAYYNLGYAYLALGDNYSSQKLNAFKEYLTAAKTVDKRKKADVYMRIADEYYTKGSADKKINDLAIENYKSALDLKSGNEDQALYYMARAYGFGGSKEDKIKCLLDIINNYSGSKYTQKAVQEVALTYYGAGNYDKAERYFNQIIKDFPNSALVKDAYHYIGDMAFKRGNYEDAERYFRKVLNEFTINDTTCKREVAALADVYRKQQKLSKIEHLSKEFACADSISNQVEDEYFSLAYELYKDSSYTKALAEFNTYLGKYPSGKYSKEVLNYKADILYQQKQEAEAIAIYRTTLAGPNDDFTELAAQRTAKYLFNSGEREAALPYYERLEQVSSRPDFLNNSRIGQMRCHFLLENFANAAEYANKVLAVQQSADIKLEGEYIKGISLAKSDRFSEALASLEYVVKNTTKITAAESKYMIAEGYYKKPDLTKAETVVRELLKMKPGYDYWIAKALILQTRILIQKKDLFQAENTIKSVIDHYTVQDDGIQTEAGELYDEIMQLKSQPKSITAPDNGTVIEIEDKTGN